MSSVPLKIHGDIRRNLPRRFNAGPVADVWGRGATGFQVRIELPEKSRLRDLFPVALIVSQLVRAESREGAALSFRTVLPGPFSMLFVRRPDFIVDVHPETVRRRESPSPDW